MHLRIGTLVSKIETMKRNYNNLKQPRFDVLLEKNLNKSEIDRLVDYYSNCNCCENHNVDKPNKLEPWIERRFNFREPKPCTCHCRHMNRHLCRVFGYD